MLTITRWAGRHPLFVRAVLLPILFYIQGRLAFIAGANLFFDGLLLSESWVWLMVGIIWIAAFMYPEKAKEIMKTAYWRVKGLEWVACTAAFGLWLFIGNQMAQRYEGNPIARQEVRSVALVVAGFSSERISNESERTDERKIDSDRSAPLSVEKKTLSSRITKAYHQYFKNAVKAIKQKRAAKQGLPLGVGIVLGVLGIGLGIVILVCGIQCGSTGGGIALGVIGGLALIGLGIWALIAGLRNKSA